MQTVTGSLEVAREHLKAACAEFEAYAADGYQVPSSLREVMDRTAAALSLLSEADETGRGYLVDLPPEDTVVSWLAPESGSFEIRMTLEQAQSVSHQGVCGEDVAALAEVPEIAAQLERIPVDALRGELQAYGAWDDLQLVSHADNLERILWIAGCDLAEWRRS